jgi:CHAT domain-containing protein
MEIDFLERSTVGNIAQRLKNEEYHILHLTCHGIYSQKEHMCYLLFEDDLGNTERIDSETLAALLARHKSLRLVVLTGCHTVLAVGHRVLGELPLSLLVKDIPAVIVMQYSVTDRSAVAVARQLFAGICRGLPLDFALTNTRIALFRAGHEGCVDFGSPILYNNNPDCLLQSVPLQCAVV